MEYTGKHARHGKIMPENPAYIGKHERKDYAGKHTALNALFAEIEEIYAEIYDKLGAEPMPEPVPDWRCQKIITEIQMRKTRIIPNFQPVILVGKFPPVISPVYTMRR